MQCLSTVSGRCFNSNSTHLLQSAEEFIESAETVGLDSGGETRREKNQ
jgi:hypothetical protein